MLSKVLFALFITVSSLLWVAPATAAPESESIIKWSMPDRLLENTDYPGYDASMPVPKYDPNVKMLPPGGWLVDFDVCSASEYSVDSTDWYVDEELVASLQDCKFSYRFQAEDVYDISVDITYVTGVSETVSQQITVQDWLIIALGDAYGSGEGNPIEPVAIKGLEDYSEFTTLAAEHKKDIKQFDDELAALEAGQPGRNKTLDETRVKRDKEANSYNQLKAQRADLESIEKKVAKDGAVVSASKKVDAAQSLVVGWQDQIKVNQKNYSNCTNFVHCAIQLNTLNWSKQSLQTAKNNLSSEKTKLNSTRDKAVIKYTSDTSIRTYSQLTQQLNSLAGSVSKAKNAYEIAKKSYQAAEDSLQLAIESIANIQTTIVDLNSLSEEATLNARKAFLDNLPVWTKNAPSWGTSEPSYADIILNGKQPGEALRCHRSMNSGQARAALKLEQADPHTSVTFLHLSCSGAAIKNLTGTYQGQDIESLLSSLTGESSDFTYSGLPDMQPIPAQIAAAAKKSRGREVDAIIISVGANDIGLGDIITDCMLGQPCNEDLSSVPTKELRNSLMASVETNCKPTTLFNEMTGASLLSVVFPFSENCMSDLNAIDTKVSAGDALRTFNDNTYGTTDSQGAVVNASLTDKLRSVQSDNNGSKATLEKHFPLLESQRVYITQYPDFTKDDAGNYCGWLPDSSSTDDEIKNIPGITQSESSWLDLTVATSLRDAIKNTSALQQWTYVAETDNGDTIASITQRHGYCANNNWATRLSESLITQQDSLGNVLPNRKGHEVYQQAITKQLIKDLYPNGLQQPPRKPDVNQTVVFSKIDEAIDVNVASGGRMSPVYLLFVSLLAGWLRMLSSRQRYHQNFRL